MLVAIAQPTQPQLSTGTNLKDQTRATSSARMLVDAYSTAVLQQPAFGITQLPEIDTNLTTAKKNCTSWGQTVKPLLIQTNTDLIDFSNQFDSFYGPLVRLANDIGTGNNRATFVQGMQILGGKIGEKQTNAGGALTTLQGFQSGILTDQGNFKDALDKGNALFGGDKGEIANLTKENVALQKAMSNDMMMIGFGATGIVVGALIIVCGALLEFETAGASTALIAAGILVAGGGTAAMTTGAIDYANKNKDYTKNLVTIAKDTAELTALNGMHDQVTSLVTAGGQAVGALQAMVNTWQTLGTQFKNVIQQVQDTSGDAGKPDFDAWLLAELQTAKSDWDDVAGTAKLIQTQCSDLPVQHEAPPKAA